MTETVVITTDELEPAVRLRAGFTDAGFAVELLTSGERLSDAVGEPVLLLLTGGLHESRATGLIHAAHAHGRLPIIGLAEATESIGREACQRLGISECFAKPIDIDEVVLIGRRLIERERLRELTGIVGETDVMEEVLERVVQIASVDSTVLIQGESGTGKELVARGHPCAARGDATGRSSRSTAPRSPRRCWRASSSATRRARSPAPSAPRKGLFELATAAPSSSTRSARCRSPRRPSCCACSRARVSEDVTTEQRQFYFFLAIAPAPDFSDQRQKSRQTLFLKAFRNHFLVARPGLHRVPVCRFLLDHESVSGDCQI